jgi:hypothetical protein
VGRAAIVLVAGALAGSVASSAAASDATMKHAFVRGVAQIRTLTGKQLETGLHRTLARLRAGRATTSTGSTGRALAIRGFASTLRGVQVQLEMVANDSGNVEAATRHAIQADRYLNAGARLLRAAGRLFGLQIGRLNGH